MISQAAVRLPHFPLHIGGVACEATSGRRFESVDPFAGTTWATASDGSADDVGRAVAAARTALDGDWSNTNGFERSRLLLRLADLVERDIDKLAEIETKDTGKLAREMRGQVATISSWFRYFAGLADKIEGASIPAPRADVLVYTRREPVGVVGAIVPWNSPLLLLAWKAAPALAAGCTMVAKPSDYTPGSAAMLADLVSEAGFPPGVFNVVSGYGPAVGQALASHPGVDKVAFTGSTAVGIEVARAAIGHVAGSLLELGGKSAHIVFPDADLEAVSNGVVAGVFAASGQTCMAGSRILVHHSIHDALVDRVVERAERIKLGDPANVDTEMGPLANERQLARVVELLDVARCEGAATATGGSVADNVGDWFVRPTVLTGVTADMTIAREEVFGPVVAVSTFDTESDAIAMANSTRYGLAGAVWTNDVRRAHRVAHRLKAGTVWINAYRMVAANVPFGGHGHSGLGHENGMSAINEYLVTKAIWVELSGETRDPFVLG